MDDIVERLMALNHPNAADAIDEIERLRAEINSLVSASEAWGRVPKLEAEIERLRTENAAIRQHANNQAFIEETIHTKPAG